MKVSILILTKDAEQTLELILSSISSQIYNNETEVIVVDSGSTDRTVQIAKSYLIRVIQQLSCSFHHAKTRNMAASLAAGEVLVFLNGDAYPSNGNWLSTLISSFDDQNVAAVYGRQIPPSNTNPVNQFRMTWNYNGKRVVKSKESLPVLGMRTYYFSTVNCAIRKSVWECFKFPEDVPVYEDTAFIKKVIEAGYKAVYEPEAKVYHAHNYSFWGIFQKYFDTGSTYKSLGYFKESNGRLGTEGISYLKSGVIFLARKGHLLWIPYFIMHTAIGFIGLTLGKYADRLPHLLLKSFSKYGT